MRKREAEKERMETDSKEEKQGFKEMGKRHR